MGNDIAKFRYDYNHEYYIKDKILQSRSIDTWTIFKLSLNLSIPSVWT